MAICRILLANSLDNYNENLINNFNTQFFVQVNTFIYFYTSKYVIKIEYLTVLSGKEGEN